jgi:UDP-glucose 4-epimerase
VGYSIYEVAAVVESVCSISLTTTYRSARGLDVRSVVLDNSHLHARLGWQASVELADGVARTWEWLKTS